MQNDSSNAMNKKKFFIKTYGCQMNVNDSEYIIGQLEQLNYVVTNDILKADLIILNSCCVRKNVEQKIYSLIGKIKKMKNSKSNTLLGLCGCLAQKEKEKIFKKAPYVDFIFGPSQINQLKNIINSIKNINRKYISCETNGKFNLQNTLIVRENNISAFVQIMRGCNNYCSYW